jgi:hypothetical protein
MAGHARPFVDVHGHVEGNRKLVAQRLEAARAGLAGDPKTVVELVPEIYGEPLTETNASWFLSEALCYLTHLELKGETLREPEGGAERWRLA